MIAGIATVTVIMSLFIIGYINQKPRYYGPKLIQTDIYKDSVIDNLAFYEALSDDQCVSVINEKIVDKAEQTKSVDEKNADGTINPLYAPLVSASAPKCKSASVFPAEHKKLDKKGFVLLALNINKTGDIEHGEVERTSGFPELDAAALKQVTETWSFEPCKKAGNAVACRQMIKFKWKNETK
jgi:protein TonB